MLRRSDVALANRATDDGPPLPLLQLLHISKSDAPPTRLHAYTAALPSSPPLVSVHCIVSAR